MFWDRVAPVFALVFSVIAFTMQVARRVSADTSTVISLGCAAATIIIIVFLIAVKKGREEKK